MRTRYGLLAAGIGGLHELPLHMGNHAASRLFPRGNAALFDACSCLGSIPRNWAVLSLYPVLGLAVAMISEIRDYISDLLGFGRMNDVDFTASWTMVLTTYGFCAATFYLVIRRLLGDGNADAISIGADPPS